MKDMAHGESKTTDQGPITWSQWHPPRNICGTIALPGDRQIIVQPPYEVAAYVIDAARKFRGTI